jgi:hypothetical protein
VGKPCSHWNINNTTIWHFQYDSWDTPGLAMQQKFGPCSNPRACVELICVLFDLSTLSMIHSAVQEGQEMRWKLSNKRKTNK